MAQACASIAACQPTFFSAPNWIGPPVSLGEGWRLHKQICGRARQAVCEALVASARMGAASRDRRRRVAAFAGVPVERRDSRHAGTVEICDGREGVEMKVRYREAPASEPARRTREQTKASQRAPVGRKPQELVLAREWRFTPLFRANSMCGPVFWAFFLWAHG